MKKEPRNICMTLSMPFNISGLQFQAEGLGSVLQKDLAGTESCGPRAYSLCTLIGYMDSEASSWHMDCLEDGICSVGIYTSLFRGHTKTGGHVDHALSLFHLHFTNFRVHNFAFVCQRQKMLSGDSWHFPVGQNDPTYSTFFAKNCSQ